MKTLFDGITTDRSAGLSSVTKFLNNSLDTDNADTSNDIPLPTSLGEITDEGFSIEEGAGDDTADYYSFTVETAGEALLTLTGITANLVLSLYDEAGVQFALANTVSDETINYSFATNTVYIFAVLPFENAVSDYTFTYVLPSDDGSNDKSAPTLLSEAMLGESNLEGHLVRADGNTTGYFSFMVAEAGTVKLTLTGMSANLDLFLYEEAGLQLDSAQTLGDETITYATVPDTLYIMGVVPFEGAVSDYELQL